MGFILQLTRYNRYRAVGRSAGIGVCNPHAGKPPTWGLFICALIDWCIIVSPFIYVLDIAIPSILLYDKFE
jgi:hypothetical protein